MKNDNIKFVPVVPKTYEVRYIDLKEPSKISKLAGYLGTKTIENCKNSLCGYSCSSSTCNCANFGFRITEPNTGTGFSASGRARDGNLSGQASSYAFSIKSEDGEVRFGSGTIGSKIEKDGANVRLSADLCNVKTEGVQARVGLSLDTGFKKDDDNLEVKAAGFGVSVGKQTGISLPIGEIKVDTEDCVIQ